MSPDAISAVETGLSRRQARAGSRYRSPAPYNWRAFPLFRCSKPRHGVPTRQPRPVQSNERITRRRPETPGAGFRPIRTLKPLRDGDIQGAAADSGFLSWPLDPSPSRRATELRAFLEPRAEAHDLPPHHRPALLPQKI